jgi:hypothetical protein
VSLRQRCPFGEVCLSYLDFSVLKTEVSTWGGYGFLLNFGVLKTEASISGGFLYVLDFGLHYLAREVMVVDFIVLKTVVVSVWGGYVCHIWTSVSIR